MAKHNKKRNVGLIHEQLVRHASEKIVEKNQGSADTVFSILEKHFHKNSELYREFRLFNSLVHTKINDATLAYRIIEESKRACINQDKSKLRKEKSLLIKEINHTIKDDLFYSRKIKNYKIFATVQSLLNEWRGEVSRLSPRETIVYEKYLVDWLTRKNENSSILESNSSANPLTLNIMIQKFNEKYGKKFSKPQIELLESKLMSDDEKVVNKITEIKKVALESINSFYSTCDNEFLISKRKILEQKINSMEVESSDRIVEKALSLVNLIEEMESDDE
jgi:hypothetical protein